MKVYEWFKVFLYVLLWVFTWTLLDTLALEYGITNQEMIQICLLGLTTIIILIQMNPDINIS